MRQIMHQKELLTIKEEKYHPSGRLAIVLMSATGQYATLTVNLPDAKLFDDEFFVKGWSENEEVIESARDSELFTDTGRRVKTGYCEAEVWKYKHQTTVPKDLAGQLFNAADAISGILSDMGWRTQMDGGGYELINDESRITIEGEAKQLWLALKALGSTYDRLNSIA